jgi:hypothetical protein
MKQEQILGIIRHVLTFGGGLLVMKGVVDDDVIQDVTGAIITFVGTLWSFIDKVKASNAEDAK